MDSLTQGQSVAASLLEDGVAIIFLSEDDQHVVATAFGCFRHALSKMDESPDAQDVISDTADSAHATGYHQWGGLSKRYNQYRRGFVFSDGRECAVNPAFSLATQELFAVLHSVFTQALQVLEEALELPNDWFQDHMGPTATNSQWHLKEFAPATNVDLDNECWLGTHTDPSLISVVIHDRPGVQTNGFGLQYAARDGTWQEIPCTGHGVAVVMIGSVLATASQGQLKACSHRVVVEQGQLSTTTRAAATLFGRPAPQALLVPLPSPQWTTTPSSKPVVTFAEWSRKVARNYEKSQRKQQRLKKSAS